MFDFPNSPVNGTQATGSGGQVYTFDGTKWVATAGAGGVTSWNTRTGAVTMSSGDVTTALTFTPYNATNPSGYQTAAQVTTALAPYAPLAAPVFTGDARAVTPAYGDNDTSVSTTAFVQSAVAPAANNVGRNLVTNGTFVVQQRGQGPWTTAVYTADRWAIGLSAADTVSLALLAAVDAERTAVGDESMLYKPQTTFTGSSSGFTFLYQKVEKIQRLSGKTVTLSFWAAANTSGLRVGINYEQEFGTGGSPSSPVAGAAGQAVTLATTWARYSVNIAMPSAIGKTFGTNGDDCTRIELWLSAGTAIAARAGIGQQSGIVYLWGVQLEIGTQATALDAGGSPQAILAECQRFYVLMPQVFFGGPGVAAAGSAVYGYVTFPVTMRATPASLTAANVSYQNASSQSFTATTSRGTGLGALSGASSTAAWCLTDVLASADL